MKKIILFLIVLFVASSFYGCAEHKVSDLVHSIKVIGGLDFKIKS